MAIHSAELPPDLRRLANRKGVLRRPPTDRSRLTDAARVGILTTGNTKRGTRGRQAVDRVTRLRRKAARPGLTARQALGHRSPSDLPSQISLMVDGPPRFIIVEGLTYRDLKRAGRYDSLVGKLQEHRFTPAEFRRRIRSWRQIAGFRFLSDPDAVLALLDERRASDQEVFVYSSGRAR
jgi:hypothetical protein